MRQTLAIHGSRATDFSEMISGIPQNSVNGWQTGSINMDTGATQEFGPELAGVSAERTTGGVLVNQIPKTSGNKFSGSVFGLVLLNGQAMWSASVAFGPHGIEVSKHLSW